MIWSLRPLTRLTAQLTPDAWIAVAAALSATCASILQLWQAHYLLNGKSRRSKEDEEVIDGYLKQEVKEGENNHVTPLDSYCMGHSPAKVVSIKLLIVCDVLLSNSQA